MKRLIIVLIAMLVLTSASPALAASLGISPSNIELDVPGNGSTTADLRVHYFSGDVQVSLVDIPLRVEPEILHVDAIDEPAEIEVTIYGDETLGSQVYNGYIKFLGMSGDMVAIAVQIRAKVTNIVDGQPVPDAESEDIEEALLETSTPATTELPSEIAGLPLNTVILIGASLVLMGLVALAISLGIRRRY